MATDTVPVREANAVDAYLARYLTKKVAAEGLDELLSGLLDMQDDIALAVIWLAENWSVDLPAFGWYGVSHQDGTGEVAALLAWCSPPQLSRVAELLDTTPVEDETPDRQGNRYRYARRSFGTGRVVLEAYHDIGDKGTVR